MCQVHNRDLLSESGIEVRINKVPNEVVDAIPFDRDLVHAAYDRDYVTRLWRVLLASQEVFSYFRSSFLGKSSPVHFFWGSFDLAVTRCSGRRAPRHPGGVPHLSDAVVQEAYSHEVSSAGFWPGGGPNRLRGVLFLRLPATGGFRFGAGPPRASVFQPRT
jgi:hypothetical protein